MSGLNETQKNQLVAAAIEARRCAYAPYSQFQVGAAIACEDGSIVSGCNVENASLGLSICAERVAVTKAISDGKKRFVGLAVAATPAATPCGSCRQFLAEFAPQLEVISVDAATHERKEWNLSQLLPAAFVLQNKQK